MSKYIHKHTVTHTNTDIYIYIYIYVCVCVCVCVCIHDQSYIEMRVYGSINLSQHERKLHQRVPFLSCKPFPHPTLSFFYSLMINKQIIAT